MKRPQCALLAEACRLLGAVLALTSQGGATSEAKGWLTLTMVILSRRLSGSGWVGLLIIDDFGIYWK